MFFLSVINAQQVTNLTATANNDTIQVSCTLETDVLCSLQLQYSENNGLTWNDCKTIQGDISDQASGEKNIYWNCLKDNVLMGNFIFKIILHTTSISTVPQKEKEPLKNAPKPTQQMEKQQSSGHFMILPGCSFGNILSYSFMAGYMKKWGGYVKIKSSFGSKDKNATKGDVEDAFFNGNSKKGRFSVYAGTVGQLHPNICMYAGMVTNGCNGKRSIANRLKSQVERIPVSIRK